MLLKNSECKEPKRSSKGKWFLISNNTYQHYFICWQLMWTNLTDYSIPKGNCGTCTEPWNFCVGWFMDQCQDTGMCSFFISNCWLLTSCTLTIIWFSPHLHLFNKYVFHISRHFQAESYHYLLDAAIKMYQLGIDWSTSEHGPLRSAKRLHSISSHVACCASDSSKVNSLLIIQKNMSCTCRLLLFMLFPELFLAIWFLCLLSNITWCRSF